MSYDTKATRLRDDLAKIVNGYSLATAVIYYRLPDAKHLLSWHLWQEYDIAPAFPRLRGFLDFWSRELDGPIHSVCLAHASLIRPAEVRYTNHELTIH